MTKLDLSSIIRTFDEAREAYRSEREVAVDLETGGFSPWTAPVHVITLFGSTSQRIAVLHYPRGRAVPQDVLDWLAGFPEIVTHNGAQFDVPFLALAGMDWERPRIYDTMIGEQAVVATSRRDVRVNLADSVKRRLGRKVDKEIDHAGWGEPLLSPEHLAYCAGDIRFLIDMRRSQEERAAQTPNQSALRCLEFEASLIPVVVEMQLNGLPIDLVRLDEYVDSQEHRATAVEETLRAVLGGFTGNLRSTPQMKKVLGDLFGERLFPDTKAERLQEYVVFGGEMGKACELLLEYRQAKQRQSMFSPLWRVESVVDHGDHARSHGRFWQLGTNTGRFSASKPNLQQMPKDAREVFGGRPGHAVGKTDYAAIEVRVAAVLADDRDMIEAFNAGDDIHRLVASIGFGVSPAEVTPEVRSVAKAMSFTLLFGGGVETFRAYAANNGSRISRDEAELAVQRFFEGFQGINRMRQAAIARCNRGRAIPITYPTGLRRVLVGAELRPTVLLNNLVQGTAAAGIKKALVLCRERDLSGYLCAVVHDEIVYEAPWSEIEQVRDGVEQAMLDGMTWALEGCPPIMIEVESSYGETWAGDKDNTHVARKMTA